MKILLTNDDGIQADGLQILYKHLSKFAEVTVVAPDGERSAASHAITLNKPVRYKKYLVDGQEFGYAVDGTPADCVKMALSRILTTKPDYVISGINLGRNDGCSVIYSGTVAAAREGALCEIPSIAVSLDTFTNPDFEVPAKQTAIFLQNINNVNIPKNVFLNINVPNCNEDFIQGVKWCKQGLKPIHCGFDEKKDPHGKTYFWMTGDYPQINEDDGTDTYALSQNFVTIVPIKCDTTDITFLNQIT